VTDDRDNWWPVAHQMWLWPVAILVSFPIGGLLADRAVNGVDSVGTALVGGLITGVVIGQQSGSPSGGGSRGSGSRRRRSDWPRA
jgi:hypothetical protein